HQPRRQMLELRQLHLQLALMGAGALCEYIEEQPGAVENSALELTLQVALLARREAVVEQHQRCVGRPYRGGDLLDLAAADESAGGNRGARPRDESDRFAPRGADQLPELPGVIPGRRIRQLDMNQY